MKALRCNTHGPATSLVVEEIPAPEALPGHVVIDVRAASLNFPDTLAIQGKYQAQTRLPYTPGCEAAGTVSAVGDGVTNVKPGDRVIAIAQHGAFAESLAVVAPMVMPLPDGVDFAAGAAMPMTFGTSYYALKHRGQLAAGEILLVLGAAGGVGTAAVALGKLMGARVIAAASSAEKLATAAAVGADDGIDYSHEDLKQRVKELTKGKGADVVYDPVGGALTETALRATGWNGRYLIIGFASGEIPRPPLNLPLLKGASLVGVFWGAWLMREPAAAQQSFAELLGMLAQGKISPVIASRHALEDYVAAFDSLTERAARGKVLFEF